jgi:hypothetical protein
MVSCSPPPSPPDGTDELEEAPSQDQEPPPPAEPLVDVMEGGVPDKQAGGVDPSRGSSRGISEPAVGASTTAYPPINEERDEEYEGEGEEVEVVLRSPPTAAEGSKPELFSTAATPRIASVMGPSSVAAASPARVGTANGQSSYSPFENNELNDSTIAGFLNIAHELDDRTAVLNGAVQSLHQMMYDRKEEITRQNKERDERDRRFEETLNRIAAAQSKPAQAEMIRPPVSTPLPASSQYARTGGPPSSRLVLFWTRRLGPITISTFHRRRGLVCRPFRHRQCSLNIRSGRAP